MRKTTLFAVATVLVLTACHKEPSPVTPPAELHPEMLYKDLQNAEVSYQRSRTIDIDGDGSIDFYFGVQLVGDPILQRDRMQFLANSVVKRNLLNDANDQSPVLNKMDTISKVHQGYTWWEISAIVLTEKITTNTNVYWDGLWKAANHNYLPIQVEKAGKLYHGWIELSVDTAAEKLILHRAALSKEEDKSVKAGY